jgi:two-component system, cell cycle sensor histidine kinase and response regulator CckA
MAIRRGGKPRRRAAAREPHPATQGDSASTVAEREHIEECLARLSDVKERLLEPRNLPEKLGLITHAVVEILGADFARVWTIEKADLCASGCPHAAVSEGPHVCRDRSRCLHLVASSGRYTHTDGGHRRVPLGCYKIGRVASGDEARFVTNDVAADPRIHDHRWAAQNGLVAFAGYRLVSAEGQPVGVLALFSQRTISAAEDRLLVDLASSTSQVILTGLAEEALRVSEEFHKTLVDAIPEGVVDTDLRGRIDFVSPNGLGLLGVAAAADAVGRTLCEFVVPEEQGRGQALLTDAMDGRSATNVGFTLHHRDGTRYPVELSAVVRRDAEGRPLSLVFVLRDLTEKAKAERALRDAEERCEQAHRLEAVGQLAGGVAHDFNNLLCAILGYSDMALGNLPIGHPSRTEVSEIKKAAERAAELTHQLLAFSRRQPLNPTVLDLNEVTTGLGKLLQRLIGEHIDVNILPAPDLWRVKADRGQLEQVIMNLAVNARDAMPDGGKLVIETANVVLDEEYVRSHGDATVGPHVVLAVSDTGCGMDANTRSRIFEPFFTTKALGKGTGLGLSTAHGIVHQSGGSIWVYSEPGRGTTFKIYLPRSAEGASIHESGRPVRQPTSPTETILVVEDEQRVRDLVIRMLQGSGYRVLSAENGKEALGILAREEVPIDLVMTDVVMPQMTGNELAQRVREIRPTVKILFVSGYTSNVIVHHGVLDAGVHFLPKPFTLLDLRKALREVLDGS